MTNKSVKREILKNDGVIIRDDERKLVAMCRGYDIEFTQGILTMRRVDKRKYFDAGSDYNPGGYIFLRRVKDITYYLQELYKGSGVYGNSIPSFN